MLQALDLTKAIKRPSRLSIPTNPQATVSASERNIDINRHFERHKSHIRFVIHESLPKHSYASHNIDFKMNGSQEKLTWVSYTTGFLYRGPKQALIRKI